MICEGKWQIFKTTTEEELTVFFAQNIYTTTYDTYYDTTTLPSERRELLMINSALMFQAKENVQASVNLKALHKPVIRQKLGSAL